MEPNYRAVVRSFDNPVKARIIATLHSKGPLTPKGLLAHLETIPQATLYRQIHALEEDGIVEIVCEEKKRAVVEKTYNLSNILKELAESVVCGNDVDAYMAMVRETFSILTEKFEVYAKRDDMNILDDGSCAKYVPIYATSEELADMAKGIMDILAPFMVRKSPDQRKHLIGCIITPAEEVERHE